MLQRRNFLLFLLFFFKKVSRFVFFFGILNMCEKIITS